MNDYPETARAAMNLADAIATDTSTVRRGEAKGLSQQQIRDLAERITNIDAPEDDEIPPEPPDGFMVAQGMRLLIVSWAEPPETDYVVEARVRTYRESNGELVLTQFVRGRSVTVPNLDPYQPDGSGIAMPLDAFEENYELIEEEDDGRERQQEEEATDEAGGA